MVLCCLSSAYTFPFFPFTWVSPCPPDKDVPSIPRVQSLIEEAWKEGLDPQGASHFNQRLQGTRAWIGATEMYSLLTSLGIRWATLGSVWFKCQSTQPQQEELGLKYNWHESHKLGHALNSGEHLDILRRGCMCERKCLSESHCTFCRPAAAVPW